MGMPETHADHIRLAREVLADNINKLMETFEKVSGARIESINVSWNIEKGAGGLAPDKEVRTIDIQITI